MNLSLARTDPTGSERVVWREMPSGETTVSIANFTQPRKQQPKRERLETGKLQRRLYEKDIAKLNHGPRRNN